MRREISAFVLQPKWLLLFLLAAILLFFAVVDETRVQDGRRLDSAVRHEIQFPAQDRAHRFPKLEGFAAPYLLQTHRLLFVRCNL